MNLGWTVGEDILFKGLNKDGSKRVRKEACKATIDSCVLGIEKKNLNLVKKLLFERGGQEEFAKLEIVLRGNHLVKKSWK